jgi:hypothetical protein
MKYLKKTGMLVLVAAAFMALAGAGSAAAESTLCSATENPCSAGNGLGVGSEFKATLNPGTQFLKTAGGGIMETSCNQTELAGKVEAATTPQVGLTTVKFAECTASEIKVLKSGALIFHQDSEHNANVTWKGFEIGIGTYNGGEGGGGPTGGSGGAEATANCVYGGEATAGITLTGGSPASVDMTITVPKISGNFFTCPSTQTWHGSFEVASPKPVYASLGF